LGPAQAVQLTTASGAQANAVTGKDKVVLEVILEGRTLAALRATSATSVPIR
jgi:hypothetical protein